MKRALVLLMSALVLGFTVVPAFGSCMGGSYIVSNSFNPLVVGFNPDATHVYSSVWIVSRGNMPVISGSGAYLGDCSSGGCDSGFVLNQAVAIAAPCSGNEVNYNTLLYEVSACDFGAGAYAPGTYMMTGDWWSGLFDGCPGADDRLVVFVQQDDGTFALFTLHQNGALMFDLDTLPTSSGFALNAPRVTKVRTTGNGTVATVTPATLPPEAVFGGTPQYDPNTTPLVLGYNLYAWVGAGKPSSTAVNGPGWTFAAALALPSDVTPRGKEGTVVNLPPVPPGQNLYVACTLRMDSGFESYYAGGLAPVVASNAKIR
jgi:hypothetical protein